MILLIGVLADPVLAYVCTRLLDRDVEFLLLDVRQYPWPFDLTWGIEPEGVTGAIRYGSQIVPLGQVRSVFARQLGRGSDEERETESAADRGGEGPPAWEEAYFSMAALANALPALVVNRPTAVRSNSSKPYQQAIIARYGFRMPRTLVTTIPEEVDRFYDECAGRVIYKSVSSRRSIVQRMTGAERERREQVRRCPTQFQEYIPGVDIRVHTVGDRIFATEILTEAIDYRYAGREGAPRQMRGIALPDELAEQCLRLAAGLELAVSGIDLRRSPEGEYYCFEVNPSPAFTFYQAHTGQRIGDALVDLLAS